MQADIGHRGDTEKCSDIAVVGTGYSWPREFAPFIAAGVLEKGLAKIIGFGRQSFAYPDFAKDILSGKGLIGTNAVLHAESVWK